MKNIFETDSPSFFLGANTPVGFYSLFGELYSPEEGWRIFVLKGGPGTGKSGIMKYILGTAEKRGIFCESIHCSSDPASLDAVIIPSLKISVADGTLPHAIEPRFPGVCEITVDLGVYRNDCLLSESRDEIIAKTLENSGEHRKCISFLKTAGIAARENRAVIAEYLDTAKLVRFANRLAEANIGFLGSHKGRVRRRFLNALTPEGNTVFLTTFDSLCEKVTVLEDGYGLCAPFIMNVIKERAVSNGLDVIECLDFMHPEGGIAQLIIPELATGIFTSNRLTPFEGARDKTVHCQRFINPDVFREHKNRLAFNVKAQDEFTAEGVNKLKQAKAIHDELEEYYKKAMNFDGVNVKKKSLCREIFG